MTVSGINIQKVSERLNLDEFLEAFGNQRRFWVWQRDLMDSALYLLSSLQKVRLKISGPEHVHMCNISLGSGAIRYATHGCAKEIGHATRN